MRAVCPADVCAATIASISCGLDWEGHKYCIVERKIIKNDHIKKNDY